jgi:hypothetical protein
MTEPFSPFPYQETMISFADDRDSLALFASPGLGKTPVTLKIIADRILEGRCRGALVVAPIRVGLITWPTQVARWEHSAWLRCVNLRTKEGMEAWKKGSADIYLINPEMMPKLLPQMMKQKRLPADMLVIDELSVAKNPSSVRFKALAKHLDRFTQRIGLTGTPVPNSYLDLFAQIKLLDDGERLGRSFVKFKQSFFDSDFMGYKFTIKAGAKETIDAKLADLCLVMLGDDYLDVPTCTTGDIEVALPPEAKAAYKTLEKELLIQLRKSEVVALNAATLTGKLLQITSGAVYGEERIVNEVHSAKIDALKKLRSKHGKEPMLVLTAFKHEAARVLAAIPGSVLFHENLIPDWRQGKIHTMVCDPRSMSHGIDGLQDGGRIAVWMTLTWSNEAYLQTNARLVRTGQSAETLIYRIICSGTVDEAVAEALRTKSDTQSGLLNALKALQLLRNQR